MTSALTVPVDLGTRSYDVIIGPDVLDYAGHSIAPLLKQKRVTIISDTTVLAAQGARLEDSLHKAGITFDVIPLTPGEGTKSFSALENLLDRLLDLGVERSDVLVAFGGGVIGDLVGFAAAILRRGVRFIQIPTTLLAQVDSSVGGKTGINTRQGKNLVGAFHQPLLVLADITTLNTLPPRHVRAGYAEVVKYGLIDDLPFFEWLETNGQKVLAGDPEARTHAIATSVRAKARIVAADEREGSVRALLNLGHTFGHALEAETGYTDVLFHGEGVAIGMILALETSAALGLVTAEEVNRAIALLASANLPTKIRDIAGTRVEGIALWGHMLQDKKVDAGQITFVMSRGLGGAYLTKDVPETIVLKVLEASE